MPVFQRYVGLGVETTYGTAVSPTVFLDVAGENMELRKQIRILPVERLMTAPRSVSERKTIQGGADVYFGFEKLPRVLKHLIGTPATTSLGSGAYRHVFTPSVRTQGSSFTMDVPRDAQKHRYTGAVPTSARFSANSIEHWGLAMNWIAADEALDSVGSVNDTDFEIPAFTVDPAAAASSDGPFLINWTVGLSTLNATASSLDLELLWNRVLRYPERSATAVGFITQGVVRGVGRMRWYYDDSGEAAFLYDAYRDQDDASLGVTWTGAVIGGGIYRAIRWHFPKLRLMGRTPTVRGSGAGNLDHETSFETLYNEATASPFQVTVTNTTASY